MENPNVSSGKGLYILKIIDVDKKKQNRNKYWKQHGIKLTLCNETRLKD